MVRSVAAAEIEMRILAALADDGVTGIFLDIESGVEIPGRKDLIALLELKAKPKRVVEQPSYLKHDPTKRHKR